ncbi:MAG: sugar kinase [Planctomycetota bacterium]
MNIHSTQRVATFGEIMLRLSPPGYERLLQASSLDMTFGGGEANVAVSLANYGIDAVFISRLPEHEVGQACVNQLRRFGVDTSLISRGGERIGIYFCENGASQRGSNVVYDRAYSSISQMTPEHLDIDAALDCVTWFHWTGITPALGPGPADCVRLLGDACKQRGITVSCDLNFRAKLWTTERAQSTMQPLMEHVDVCICNEEDAQKSLGMEPENTDVERGELDINAYARLAARLKAEYSFSHVAITLRESFSASRNGWSALLLDDGQCNPAYQSKRYDIQIVDRVGGGDSFAGGLIAGLLNEADSRQALEFAVAASCLKQTIPGDFNLVSDRDVSKLLASGGSGRVER